jgi:hypothetical protein
MTRKLNDADRAAVDMLFDRLNARSNGGNGRDGYVAMSGAIPEGRMEAVERVLNLLSQMPTPEPSPDLAIRTLNRIARSAGTMPSSMPATPFINPNQPMA